MRIRMRHAVACAAIAWSAASLAASPTHSVIEVPTAGGPLRILEVVGDTVDAYVLSLPGGNGYYDIRDDGTMPGVVGECSPYSRNVDAFAARGLGVVLVNSTSYPLQDIVAFLRARRAVPIWIAGGSASTGAAASWAGSLPASLPLGLVLSSPAQIGSLAASVARPTLVVFHAQDALAFGIEVFNGLTAAPVKEWVELTGGSEAGCGYHLYQGLDVPFMDAVEGFIDRHNASLGGTVSGKVPVIEYFNASFGHYFMTADSDEIAGLDAGGFNFAFVRTQLGFNAWSTQAAGTVPVCRFFTTPGNFGTRSSHFYTANPIECEGLKSNPNWIYEKIAFYIAVPTAGACPGGTVPIYRMYNHGQTGAPNHRFTTDFTLYNSFISTQGWDPEGIGFCAPP